MDSSVTSEVVKRINWHTPIYDESGINPFCRAEFPSEEFAFTFHIVSRAADGETPEEGSQKLRYAILYDFAVVIYIQIFEV